MRNFTYHNTTKIVFGEGTLEKIGEEIAPFAKKVLYLYGKGSIKKNGIYEKTTESLRKAGVEWVEMDGVKANPVVSHARQAVELAKREKVDAVVAVGGGSVIDEAKAIVAGAVTENDVWEFYNRSGTPILGALPLFAVLTMSATGSEMNGGTVLTNPETNQKLGIGHELLYPKVSILDPTALVTVPADQTAYGAVDAVTHLLESYFTRNDPFTPIQDRYVQGIVRTIIEITKTMQDHPGDMTARSTFMWAATLAWNGMAPAGVGDWSTPNHLIGHSMSALFDTPHGASLSISLSGWMPWYMEQSDANTDRLVQLGHAVFELDPKYFMTPQETAKATIEKFREWFRSIKSPTKLSDIGVDDAGMKQVALNIDANAALWGLPEYNGTRCMDILKRCE